ncbi:hypothetical protein TanjilG_29224 [Lupinus angustifolius]|uniref:Uncharacterized protein n=1 Tax=Lupinus angustifolius TaxID=3871 RepID=A0A1J7GX19_LUPAN|nr:PREDICTED: protein PLANT CADMIUM RESISTANCE 2-like [Lupinus angustifolius]OIV94124.1 hypothetical protein TanjilG_29224 [Lupinus angustifolius]
MANKVAHGSWSTGLCHCCSDCHSCCLTLWCPCISFGRIAEITDKGTSSCCVQGTLFFILAGFAHVASCYACIYRTKLRRLYGIEGNQCKDCLASCLCIHLSICQSYRELQARGFDLSAGWNGNVEMRSRGVMEAPAVAGAMSR